MSKAKGKGKGKSKGSECVQVMVRVRPLNKKEKNNGSTNVLKVERENGEITIRKPNSNSRDTSKCFTYDAVFPPEVTQESVYEESGFHIVESVSEGFNGTIFAYGQTGCGKTYTMMGPDPNDLVNKGIIPRTFGHIFKIIETTTAKKFLVQCSFIEIYNE